MSYRYKWIVLCVSWYYLYLLRECAILSADKIVYCLHALNQMKVARKTPPNRLMKSVKYVLTEADLILTELDHDAQSVMIAKSVNRCPVIKENKMVRMPPK